MDSFIAAPPKRAGARRDLPPWQTSCRVRCRRPRPTSPPSPPRRGAGPGAGLGPERSRLRAQYAEISQLAGGLAHEIRNPLSTLQLNLQLLAEDFHDPETPRDRRALPRIE